MIKKLLKLNLYLTFLLHFYKFYKCFFINFFEKKSLVINLNNKKNLFFKKRNSQKNLISKRLAIILKKRKKLKFFRVKRVDKGNFFFKKFFFKTLLRNRNYLKKFFFLNGKVRQKKISKFIFKQQTGVISNKNHSYEHSLMNILLRSHFFLFIKDLMFFIKMGYIYINNRPVINFSLLVNEGDCVQLPIFNKIFSYINSSKKILKKKTMLFKHTAWKFFKQKFFKKQQQIKSKKKKTPKYLHLFLLFKLNTPRYLEVDYTTLTIFFLKKQSVFLQSSYYLNKLFSFKMFPLYNFKKIN